jgi:hypothetical protein
MEKPYNYGDYYHNNNENTFNQTGYGMEATFFPEFIILMMVSYTTCMIWKFCKRCDNDNDNDDNNDNNQSLLPDTTKINKKTIQFTEEMNDKECSICLEEFKKDEELIKIECQHYFHGNCIDIWFKTNGTCPLCRLDLV